MSLEKKYSVPYCQQCKALLIRFEDRVIQYVRQEKFFVEDGTIYVEVVGDDQVDDTIPDEDYGCTCPTCGDTTRFYVLMPEELFKPILRCCYRNGTRPDDIFEIELKQNKNSLTKMRTPSARDVQDALFIRGITD